MDKLKGLELAYKHADNMYLDSYEIEDNDLRVLTVSSARKVMEAIEDKMLESGFSEDEIEEKIHEWELDNVL